MIPKKIFCFLFCFPLLLWSQEEDKDDVESRLYMPSLQIGYINNQSDQLSGGLFIQTSIEYKTKSGLFFRANYDDFDTDYNVTFPESTVSSLKGKVSFSEFIGGLGYRLTRKKHNFLMTAQAGGRFYSFPILENNSGDFSIELDSREVLIGRYTLGYEYEIEEKTFLTAELFASHSWRSIDYWTSKPWASGFTVGITTTIF